MTASLSIPLLALAIGARGLGRYPTDGGGRR